GGGLARGERLLENTRIGRDPYECPERQPCEAHEPGTRKGRLEPLPGRVMLLGLGMIRVEQEIGVDQDHQRWRVPSTCSRRPETLSRPIPGFSFPRSRAIILNGTEGPARRLVSRPRRSMSLTTSRNVRPERRASDLSFRATSSSRVSVVLTP